MQIRTSTIFRLRTFLTSNLQTRNNNASFPLQRQQAKACWRNGNSSAVQQAAVLRAWQRLRWLAKTSRALCNLLTLSELSQTSLEHGPLGIHEEEKEECFSKQAVVQQPPFFTTPPPFLTVEIRRCSNWWFVQLKPDRTEGRRKGAKSWKRSTVAPCNLEERAKREQIYKSPRNSFEALIVFWIAISTLYTQRFHPSVLSQQYNVKAIFQHGC